MPHDSDPPSNDGRLELFATGTGLLRWLAGIVVLLVVAEIAARGLTSRTVDEIRWYDAAAQQRIALLDDRGDAVDVAFAGTSAAWQAFVPAEFTSGTGRSAINVGLAGAVPTVMGPWLVEEVQPRSSPELVVWGLTALDFAPEYGELQEDAYDSAFETADGWLAALDRSVSSASTLVSSRRLLRSPSALFGSDERRRGDDLAEAAAVTGPDGERIDFDVDAGPEGVAIQRSRLTGFEIDRRDVDAAIEAIDALRAEGTRVVLVEVPVPDRFVDQLPQPGRDMAATRAAIREIGESTDSDVVHMGDVLGDTNFVDSIHLDAQAASLITQWTTQMLATLESGPPDGRDTVCWTAEVVDGTGFVVPVDVCRHSSED